MNDALRRFLSGGPLEVFTNYIREELFHSQGPMLYIVDNYMFNIIGALLASGTEEEIREEIAYFFKRRKILLLEEGSPEFRKLQDEYAIPY